VNAWPFVLAAYAIALGASGFLTLASLRAMRRAEKGGQ
jgi:hypothetical protein